jgi:hypothetical protein
MNSTHGPFYMKDNINNLPPLSASAMNKYERSTKASEYENMIMSGHRRAATNMDIRTTTAEP